MKKYDIIIIGAGHAGCESALASARLGKNTLLLATNLDTVAHLACNPSIGGTAKGQIVREIDALGGQMAINADKCVLQMRMLNRGKGFAVHSPRSQVDKHKYHTTMKTTLENTENLTLRQAEATQLIKCDKGFKVVTAVGIEYSCDAVVLCCGVYLNSRTIVGKHTEDVGPNGFSNAKLLTDSLVELGFKISRFKTGTPARVKFSSLDTSQMQTQLGETDTTPFSFISESIERTKRCCYLTYTTQKTKEIILANLDKAPMYNGDISGVGPRYCPSIEDKVIRFKDKEQHQVFLEPEGEDTLEFYVQGVSSSMPADVQEQIYKSITGLEDVEIMRDAYAIEYDCIDATQLTASLMYKDIDGLFCAGQINGTSGYEEAACQGLVAGINAVHYLNNKPPLILTRENSYIGVLIDDITTKPNTEPYRMMTSRAEHRLVLRQDNADMRLTEIGREIGLVDDYRYNLYLEKKESIEKAGKTLKQVFSPKTVSLMYETLGLTPPTTGVTVLDMLKRSEITIAILQQHLDLFAECSGEVAEQIEINAKYKGYIEKQEALIKSAEKMESKLLPDLNYDEISGLRLEARQKLNKIKPRNLGQASRILGVSPADIQVLIVYLMQNKN